MFGKLGLTDFRVILILFFVGLSIRSIPELLAFPVPIGFDTIYYAKVMKSGVIWSHWSSFFTSSWLLYAFIVPFYNILLVDPFLLLKIVAPLLYGLNVAGVYWFARKMLGWDMRMGLLAGGFFALQLASLRISWDLLRNIFGLGILLFTLPFVYRVGSKRGFACFIFLSLLTVFAHEYAAVILLVSVLSLAFWRFLEEDGTVEFKRLVLAASPALAIFLTGVFLRVFPVQFSVEWNVIKVGDVVSAHPGGLFFLVDYLQVKSSVDFYSSYGNLVLNVAVLFTLLYVPYLVLVLKGFFRDRLLNSWTGLLLTGAFGCLLVPVCALELWHRWMFMLVYPFTFYAVNGVSNVLEKRNGENRSTFHFSSMKVKGMVLLTILLSILYLFTPVFMVHAGASISSLPVARIYFSNSPTVPYEDVTSVVEAMGWLNRNLDESSCGVLHNAFFSWGELFLDRDHRIVYFVNDIGLAVKTAVEHGFSSIVFVWWNEPIGWYGITVPDNFVELQNFGRISVYEYVGESVG